MKFINYLEKIKNVDVLGLISLSIFFLFFAIMLTWVFRANKQKLKEIGRIPLDH
jgi:hypothetical protein